MKRTTRATRMEVQVKLLFFEFQTTDKGAWYESPREVAMALAWGKRKEELLGWLRVAMERKLTARERQCLTMHYFENRTYVEIGQVTGSNPSSAWRAVDRAMVKLRKAALADTSWQRKKEGPNRMR